MNAQRRSTASGPRVRPPRSPHTAPDRAPDHAAPTAQRAQPLPLSHPQPYGLSVPTPDSFGRPEDFKRYVDPASAEGQAQQKRFLNEIAAHNARQREMFGDGEG